MTTSAWLPQLRNLYERHFECDWASHVAAVNEQFGLVAEHAFAIPCPGLPPMWFNGDVEAVEAGRWVLVVSLNHAGPSPEHSPEPYAYNVSWFLGHTPDRSRFWNYMRTHNRDWWYPRFFSPLVRVASAALGEDVLAEAECEFATTRMVFVELCPYASGNFALEWATIEKLLVTDRGWQVAAEVRRLLLEEARPALVLVNGMSAVWDMERLYGDRLEWQDYSYPSVDRPERTLWHNRGLLHSGDATIPIAGFPFLRKARTHNSAGELMQLGQLLRNFVDSR